MTLRRPQSSRAMAVRVVEQGEVLDGKPKHEEGCYDAARSSSRGDCLCSVSGIEKTRSSSIQP